MAFEIDFQTVRDLGIFSENPSLPSVFAFYNRTKTFGGKVYLKEMMKTPMEDLEDIVNRRESILFFTHFQYKLSINAKQFDFIDHYFRLNTTTLKTNFLDRLMKKIWVRQNLRNDLYLIQMGVEKMVFLLVELEIMTRDIPVESLPQGLKTTIEPIKAYLALPELSQMLVEAKSRTFKILDFRYDFLFREKYRKESIELVNLVYSLDAILAVAETSKIHGLAFPEFTENKFEFAGLFHPLIKDPVSNDLKFHENQNLCLITGPNMAGKSTFLKSLGLAIYLANLGFPVPAKSFSIPVFKGLVTTVNLPDDLGMGHSHFFSEVVRLNNIAQVIKKKKRVLVIIDELFRGTNSKDAYEGTYQIIEAFSKLKTCVFFLSTHISEVADKIHSEEDIQFKCMDAKIMGDKPLYNYRLLDGVSKERLGMWILTNEKIIAQFKALQ